MPGEMMEAELKELKLGEARAALVLVCGRAARDAAAGVPSFSALLKQTINTRRVHLAAGLRAVAKELNRIAEGL